jgi:hypothetical protein
MTKERLTSRRLYPHRLAELAMAAVLLAGPAVMIGSAQSPQMGGQGYPQRGQWGQVPTQQTGNYPGQNGDPAMEEKRLNALNTERQKNMIADTNKLVKLAAELNAEVNGKNLGQLTPDQLRKVAEIEKLAHGIREKMSTSVKPAPSMMDSPPLVPNMR